MKHIFLVTEELFDSEIYNKLQIHSQLKPCIINIIKPEHFNFSELSKYQHKDTFLIVEYASWMLPFKEFFSQLDLLIVSKNRTRGLDQSHAVHSDLFQDDIDHLLGWGAKNILVEEGLCSDYYEYSCWIRLNHVQWLSNPQRTQVYTNSRSIFNSALLGFLSMSYTIEDSVILAKMYLNQAIRLRNAVLGIGVFPENNMDLPLLDSQPLDAIPQAFKPSPYLGLYPIVAHSKDLEKLLQCGVKTIQIRIKEIHDNLELEIKKSIDLAQQFGALLFINDYWQLALQLGAQAVHLGQDDLIHADIAAIRERGLYLGVSVYCYFEAARAHAVSPSYIAIGPIFPTSSKQLNYSAHGVDLLKRWQRTLNYPIVAIGGITLQRTAEVVKTGVIGIALISAISNANNLQDSVDLFLDTISTHTLPEIN